MKIAFTVFALATAIACEVAPPGATELSPDEFLKSLPANALVLDVRTAEEFASRHVPGAVNISHNELASRIEELGADTSKPVVVYCERGGRAGKAATVLLEAGFSDVRHLAGDMSEWRSKGRAMETSASLDTRSLRR